MEKLDVRSYKLLKRLYKKGPQIIEQNREFNCLNKANYLERVNLLSDPTPWEWEINNNGIEYILKQRTETIKKWIPLIISYTISITAIIISIIALNK